MLANVLPGLREVRAPLVAGYMWLISAWLLIHDSIPTEQEARGGPWEPFFDLDGIVSSFGLALVLSVLAYLIGSLSEGVFRLPMELGARRFRGGPSWQLSWKGVKSLESQVQDRISGVLSRLADEGLWLQQVPEYKEASLIIEDGFSRLNRAGLVFKGVRTEVNYRVIVGSFQHRESWNRDDRPRPTWVKVEAPGNDETRGTSERLPREQDEVEDFFNEYHLDWDLRPADPYDEVTDMTAYEPEQIDTRKRGIQEILAHDLAQYITSQIVKEEMTLVGTRLLGKETDLFHEFDRQRGESSFRLVIIPPLLTFAIVLAIKVNLAFLLLLGSVPLFYWQGVRYRQAASDVLIDSIVADRVKAPAIEKLEQAANRAIEHAKRNSAIPPQQPRGSASL
jgi:hypothetical protein